MPCSYSQALILLLAARVSASTVVDSLKREHNGSRHNGSRRMVAKSVQRSFKGADIMVTRNIMVAGLVTIMMGSFQGADIMVARSTMVAGSTMAAPHVWGTSLAVHFMYLLIGVWGTTLRVHFVQALCAVKYMCMDHHDQFILFTCSSAHVQ